MGLSDSVHARLIISIFSRARQKLGVPAASWLVVNRGVKQCDSLVERRAYKKKRKMSCSDENRPAVANVSQSNGEGVKAKEVVKNSQVEKIETDEVEGVPKPVPRAGEK